MKYSRPGPGGNISKSLMVNFNMLQVTKIFRFETAHAIHGYPGPCNHIHGHSYELHVTLTSTGAINEYIAAPGFFMDFKELKKLVKDSVIDQFDHCLILSEDYLKEHPGLTESVNLRTWLVEPSAENMLLFIRDLLQKGLPEGVLLYRLRLYETRDSYAEWRQDGRLS